MFGQEKNQRFRISGLFTDAKGDQFGVSSPDASLDYSTYTEIADAAKVATEQEVVPLADEDDL